MVATSGDGMIGNSVNDTLDIFDEHTVEADTSVGEGGPGTEFDIGEPAAEDGEGLEGWLEELLETSAGTVVVAPAPKRIRVTRKSAGCQVCGGPCGTTCCGTDLAIGDKIELDEPGSAAAAFARARQKRNIAGLEPGDSGGHGPSSSSTAPPARKRRKAHFVPAALPANYG